LISLAQPIAILIEYANIAILDCTGAVMEFEFLLGTDDVIIRVNSYTEDEFLFGVLEQNDEQIIFDHDSVGAYWVEKIEREFLRICENDRIENDE
jgi:hypothetical protein